MGRPRNPRKPRCTTNYPSFESFYDFDPKNDIDKLIKQLVTQSLNRSCKKEWLMVRKILAKRFSTGISANSHNIHLIDTEIQNAIKVRMQRHNLSRDEVVRNQFLVHFNIKT